MRRREFITLLGSATAAWPIVARAQQPGRMRHIGVLIGGSETDPEIQSRVAAFQKELQELGWIEGRNLRIDRRWAAGELSRIRIYAAELVGLRPEVILGANTPVVEALRQQTHTIPIVFSSVTDPVESGLVQSLARPGGNATGVTTYEPEMSGKWVELISEVATPVTRVALLFNPMTTSGQTFRPVELAARSLGLAPTALPVRDPNEIEDAIAAFGREPNGALIILSDVFTTVHRKLIITLAASHRLPAIYPFRFFAVDGGLMSYGIDQLDLYRRAASYVDRILKGEKPADLPVMLPTKFELAINLKTAKALGLTVPPRLLVRADEVIE
jgi:putative ABC transport system substrate-binding protein